MGTKIKIFAVDTRGTRPSKSAKSGAPTLLDVQRDQRPGHPPNRVPIPGFRVRSPAGAP
jgi:hypothetical protein